jgi:hypothetical protein
MLKALIKSLENKPLNSKGADKVFRKQTLESLPAVSVAGVTPGILGPSFPTKVEKNHIF